MFHVEAKLCKAETLQLRSGVVENPAGFIKLSRN
jgi:hypothetical protein